METDNKIDSKPHKNAEDSTQIYWILGAMVVAIGFFFLTLQVMEGSHTVKYEGLTFTKTMFGEIPLYQYIYRTDNYARGINGNVIKSGERDVTILLRNNPETNTVPAQGEINYPPRDRPVYITLASEGLFCDYSSVALAGLSSFLSQNSYTLQVGSSNESDAKANNMTYVTCENHPNNMVISLQGGEESSISVEGNCHTLTVANCEVLQVTEKFIVQSIIESKGPK